MKKVILFFISSLVSINTWAQEFIDTAYASPTVPTINDNIDIIIEGMFMGNNHSIDNINVSVQDSSIQIALLCGNGMNNLQSPYLFDTLVNIGMLEAQTYYLQVAMIRIPDIFYTKDYTFEVFNPTSIEIENNFSVLEYPNPASEALNIELQEGIKNAELRMQNLEGQVVYARPFDYAQGDKDVIDVNGFANGVYLLTLQNEEERTTVKIVVQH